MAQMTLQYFLDSFRIFKEVFQTYMRMAECMKESRTAKDANQREKSKMMADSIKKRLDELGLYDYCDQFDLIGNILEDKWPKLMSNINWDE